MPNTNGEDLLNKNLNKPLIRTMEDDLRALKTGSPGRAPLPPVQSSKASLPKIPQNLPISPASPPSGQQQKSFFRPPVSPKPQAAPEVKQPAPKIVPSAPREGYFATKIGVPKEPIEAPVEPIEEFKPEVKPPEAKPVEEEQQAPLEPGVATKPKFVAPKAPAPKPAAFKPLTPKTSEPELSANQPFFSAPPKPKAPVPPPQSQTAAYVPPHLPVQEQEVVQEQEPAPVTPPVAPPSPVMPPKPVFRPQAPVNPFASPKPKPIPKPPELPVEEAAPAQAPSRPVFRPQLPVSSPRPPAMRPVASQHSARKQPFGLEAEYTKLTPEMRLARQGSSFSMDLEEGMRKDAEAIGKPIRPIREKLPSVDRPATARTTARLGNNEYALPGNPGSELVNSMAKEHRTVGSLGSVVKTILKFIIILLIIGGLAFGIYYFFKVKGGLDDIFSSPQVVLVPGISQFEVKANIGQDSTPEIKDYFKSNAAKTMGASEVLIKERSGNKTMKIGDFGKTLKINIPPSFAANLDGNYSLLAFNYPQDNYLRLGLVLKLKDENTVADLAKKWEPTMFNDLGALFLGAPVSFDESKKFGEGAAYKNISIRYLALGKNKMALNYAVDKGDKLFIVATSKEDIYYIIDQIQASE